MKTAVVTGATRGIGKAVSQMLLNNGWRVVGLFCENSKAADDFAKSNSHMPLTVIKCDITDSEKVSKVFSDIGRIDLLVNNAGIADINLLTDQSFERIRRIIDVNLTGAVFCTKAVLPSMIREKSGSIINISSMWGEVGASCEAVYSAAKAGIIGFTKAMAKEVGLSGIRVNCISAGVIMTEMNSSLSEDDINLLKAETPLGAVGTPENIADAVEFLISPKAEFITGEILKVNGGLVI